MAAPPGRRRRRHPDGAPAGGTPLHDHEQAAPASTLEVAQRQFDLARAPPPGSGAAAVLREPDVPYRSTSAPHDDGDRAVFTGYASSHNLGRPGQRRHPYHQDVTITRQGPRDVDDWKCAVVGIPYGGGRAAWSFDPRSFDEELEGLSRRFFTVDLGPHRPERDIPARTSTPPPDHGLVHGHVLHALGYTVPGV